VFVTAVNDAIELVDDVTLAHPLKEVVNPVA
jgi:hypothetical protein